MLRKFFSSEKARYAELVELAYLSVLHRSPDAGGLETYTAQLAAGQLDAAGLLRALTVSDEFLRLSERLAGGALLDGTAAPLDLTDAARRLSDHLAACAAVSWEDYLAAWRDVFENPAHPLIIGQREYGVTHQQRFFETINALVILGAAREQSRLLEFGASDFSALYRRFFPQLMLAIADRPVADDYIGFTAEVAHSKLGASTFHSIDLQAPEQFASLSASLPRYTHILFCEVLEHLVVNPVEVLRFLLSLLEQDGVLYLTTPNFFRRENLEKVSNRVNPQEVYPASGGNWDAHFHHREFGVRELLAFAEAAGGRVQACYFSSCWDAPGLASGHDESLGNIVMVLSPQ